MGLTLVALGFGLFLLPSWFNEANIEGIVFRRIEGKVPQVESGVACWREAESRVVQSFLSCRGRGDQGEAATGPRPPAGGMTILPPAKLRARLRAGLGATP
jgi:hypothetical protein